MIGERNIKLVQRVKIIYNKAFFTKSQEIVLVSTEVGLISLEENDTLPWGLWANLRATGSR